MNLLSLQVIFTFPEDNAINELIEANGFKSYLDGHKHLRLQLDNLSI